MKLVVNTGRPSAQVAKEIGVAEQTLSQWVKTYRDQVGGAEPISESERAELRRLRKEKRQWELDRAFLNKASIFFALCSRGYALAAFKLTLAEKKNFSVSRMVRLLGVSRSGFCAWLKRGPSKRQARSEDLAEKITRSHAASDGVYRAPRILVDVCESGKMTDSDEVLNGACAECGTKTHLWCEVDGGWPCTSCDTDCS